MSDDAGARRRTKLIQRYLLKPPAKALAWLGLSRRHLLIETIGRKSGKTRRTVVGYTSDGTTLWVVAEQGRYAGYVRNLEATTAVRVRLKRRWHKAVATIVDEAAPSARLDTFGDERHAALVRKFGTSLLSIRIDVSD